MPRTAKFTEPSNKLMRAPKISVRTRKLGTRSVRAYDDVIPLPGKNKPETMIARALDELRIQHVSQQTFGGGSILGGARSDEYLPSYGMILLYQGPFHRTAEGAARDILSDATYINRGLRIGRLYERDLPRIKPRLLEIIGVPL